LDLKRPPDPQQLPFSRVGDGLPRFNGRFDILQLHDAELPFPISRDLEGRAKCRLEPWQGDVLPVDLANECKSFSGRFLGISENSGINAAYRAR
jgi:hypothetical protein